MSETASPYDLVVVGAGPAGMAGAVAAADAGLDVLVVDEQARAGGQIFRRPPEAFTGATPHYAPYHWAAELIERFEQHPRISTRFRHTVYGILRDRDEAQGPFDDHAELHVGVSGPNGGELLPAKRILIATGAYDMSVAFPGWTKPGVMTVGAVQSLLKSQKVLAGREIVLAGSHPLLLIAAEQLLRAGATVKEIAFARGMPSIGELVRAMPAAPGHLSVFVEAAKAMAMIVKHRVKVSTRTIVSEAHGDGSVTGVTLSKVDAHWTPTGSARTIAADLLAIGYGFSPSTELARQAGCAMEWDSPRGGWLVEHDAEYETSAHGIYVAGEPTGVAGAEMSWASGARAGLAIARSLGTTEATLAPELRAAEKRLRGATRFAKVVQEMFEPHRFALADLSRQPDTHVCRCELVTSAEAEEVLDKNPFISSVNALKLECRTGMGPCQGRYCEGTVSARVAQARGSSIERSGYFTAHLPVKPVPIGTYRSLDDAPEASPEAP